MISFSSFGYIPTPSALIWVKLKWQPSHFTSPLASCQRTFTLNIKDALSDQQTVERKKKHLKKQKNVGNPHTTQPKDSNAVAHCLFVRDASFTFFIFSEP